MATYRSPLGLNPDSFIAFASLRSARGFVRGYCVERVIARRPRSIEPFVICHPVTAKRRGWKVVA